MQQISHPTKNRTETRHRVRELLEALPVDTLRAKLSLMDKTGIPKHRFYRIYNDPHYKISPADLIALASFFCVESDKIFANTQNLELIVQRIMRDCEAIRNLTNPQQ